MAFDITQANWGRDAAQPKVVQVVNTVVNYNVTTTSNTFVDSPLSAAITPLYSDSSIRIIYNVYGGSSSGMGVPLRVKRDIGGTTSIPLTAASDGTQTGGEATTYYAGYAASGYVGFNQSFEFLDTPSTTNEVKYFIQFCEAYSSVSASYINRSHLTSQAYTYNSCSSISLEEIVQ